MKATAFIAVCKPIWSASIPTGVTDKFAIPHETPCASELAMLRDSGQRRCAIAVDTGVLA